MNSRILKYKFGPFWIKVRVTLTPLTQADNAGAAVAVLRLERPNICGGCVDLPIGRHGFPMTLLQRSVNDRRKLRLTIRYGAAGKSIRLQAPTVEVYLDWIAHLRYVFEIKKPHQAVRAKRYRNDTASTDDLSDDAGSAKTNSNRNADNQRVFELSSADWARWLARDIRNGVCLPEAFRLTVDGCKRLRLSEILAIAQPFFD
ncbi:hypothetical protein BBJ28_00020376 [Nothophytophthora sp. Chile5]|nr:hypothetical protein BBJ28_00020376 [Nothophytophthora sp. Chile5]